MGEVAVGEAEELETVLEDTDSLAIVCHYQPDPDCLASAYALQWIAARNGVTNTDIFYQGHITHQEIRSFIGIFDISLQEIDDASLESYDIVAFVDHSISGTEVEIPPTVDADVVIDNVEPPGDPDASFVDTRPEYGSTAAILAEYVTNWDDDPPELVASALLFAIHRERLDDVRYPTRLDYRAALDLFPYADIDLIEEVYGSSLTPETLDAVGRAIHHRTMRGSVLVSSIGQTSDSGALPQAAEYLLRLEGIRTVLVMGVVNGDLWLSGRSFDPRIDIGMALNGAFSEFGTAGGHQDRAGGQLSLGIFADTDMDSPVINERLFQIVADRFFRTLALDED
ncbi:phosphoesterase RecJ domain protein [Haladaptatus paucihalophilus DX253]|nr:DHH family phosphoesterase [Haladaptatus paucihalophilus]EFW90933.1 phosphoesterase RecJ domain protein [Haladaptatus paucihalophilus DX253]